MGSFPPWSSLRSKITKCPVGISDLHLILYGFVYDIDYSGLRDYNASRSEKAGETGVGYTESHACKAAFHEAVN